jgi:hypothetical protein
MNGTAELEGRYRRLLALYPAEHRRAHEDEMLGVLMTGARAGQGRPGLAESADLILGALRLRLRRTAALVAAAMLVWCATPATYTPGWLYLSMNNMLISSRSGSRWRRCWHRRARGAGGRSSPGRVS